MKISDTGLTLIKKFEGCHLTAYKCPAGIWTIGFGHTAGVRQGDKITQEQADKFLIKDVEKAEKAVNAYENTYHYTQNEYDSLVSFTYNCGAGNFRNLIKLGSRSKKIIAEKMLLYNKAGGVVLRGLTRRRQDEHALFVKATNSNTKNYYPVYIGTSERIDDVLAGIGAVKDYDNTKNKQYLKRKPIAIANGIKTYTGTATQNLKLIALAKKGKLVSLC